MSLRCAIYTRKSSDEGLDQTFNSLHAQREACEAYIRSQAGEGWSVKRDRYDDGGHSGGSMNRPSFQRLLSDVEARKVDAVVVYKVDRLTRSLTDFARIIETFDRAGVSFVSVTQAFNTTSSSGRLALNVLLSFAQFEREVTGERIRDKIAASKAKGMWMGGLPPLGYDPPAGQKDRTLLVNADEARTVQFIFRKYLELGSLSALHDAVQDEGVRSKRWVTQEGRRVGGYILTSGALRHLLHNRVYVGEISHKGATYPGRHLPIVDRPTFEAVQALLVHKSWLRRTRVPKARAALLFGRLFDAYGQLMEPRAFRRRGGPWYKYYASLPIAGSGDVDDIRRVRGSTADTFVADHLRRLLGLDANEIDADRLRTLLVRAEVHASTVQLVLKIGAVIEGARRASIEGIRPTLRPGEELHREPADARRLRVSIPARLRAWGGRSWTLGPDGSAIEAPRRPDPMVIQRLRTAHQISRACGAQPDGAIDQLRHARAPPSSHQSSLLRWAFLAPDIRAAILDGSFAGDALRDAHVDIPLSWERQRRMFGCARSLGQLH